MICELQLTIDDCCRGRRGPSRPCAENLKRWNRSTNAFQPSIVNRKSSIACLAICLFLAPFTRAESQRYEYSSGAMGGVFSVALYSGKRTNADAAASAAFAELHRLDRMLSNYRPDSEWSEVNRYAAERAVKISRELLGLLSSCLDYSRRSKGAFDITVGPLMKAWGFYDGSGSLIDEAVVKEALAQVGFAHILLDSANYTVRFARAGVEMDPGGIGKGYAVDRMIEVLKRRGIKCALISAAGSSIYALGAPPGQEGWQVKIRDPNRAGDDVGDLLLKDESLSTSGRLGKSFRANGRVYGHILDPRTGYPASGVSLVAVLAPHTLDSEAWTKAFLVNGRRWTAGHIPQGFRVFLCGEEAGSSPCGWLP
jgi:thiamine biosynthesis lipoprotein